ncbi:3-oxoacyl-[acyl-carrier-protein] reductase FabG [Bradyrhizobium ivorense]|uniref:3-oxoacyl-[acyl-carrier-protein] reductase FabG n=1 Tax=Bradyrhizobium ivorense TaxID=2511166 RepID=A0A508TG91_9BRAD|nr:SDR family NAD(P)-dependent oxidoreductase [Bradyrhizobium ivorense]VIO72938.1 3-oxoacyl-[acyl-carrier-protein] reductase FabG [Bradyrhizobium ivorense]
MNLGLDQKVALITAASRGLGRATAEALVAEGANIVALARSASDLAALEAENPSRCTAMPADLLDPMTAERAVDCAIRAYGRLDIVVVNTPGPPPMKPLEATDEDFVRAFDTTFYPAVRLIRAAAKHLCESKSGRIVIVSSTSVKGPKDFLSLSAAARSALWAWAKSAAPALFEHGVTVNAVFAGPHATDRVRELGASPKAMGRPEDFGAIVASICGEATKFVTGTGYLIDGGEFKGL